MSSVISWQSDFCCLCVCNVVATVIGSAIHCVQKKTPTHIFCRISMNYLWI